MTDTVAKADDVEKTENKLNEKNYRQRISEFRERNKNKLFGLMLILIVLVAIIASLFKFPELVFGIIAVLVIIALFVMFYGRESVKELFRKKRLLLEEISLAEQKFFKRRITEEELRRILKEKEGELVKVDARIEALFEAKELNEKEMDDRKKERTVEENEMNENKKEILMQVAAKKKHYLKELLEQKDILLRERELIAEKFHKRKIDQKALEELMGGNQQELIEVEARIRSIYSEENIEEIFADLKNKLAELKQKKISNKTIVLEEIASELVEKDREEHLRRIG